jgi:hypothetical protein
MTGRAHKSGGLGLVLGAVVLSLLIPDTGHLLLRRPLRGAIWFGGFLLLALAFGTAGVHLTLALGGVAAIDACVLALIAEDSPAGHADHTSNTEDRR